MDALALAQKATKKIFELQRAALKEKYQ